MSDADPQFFFKILPTFFGEETATQIRKHGFGGGSIHLIPSFGKLRQCGYRSVYVAEIVLKHVPRKQLLFLGEALTDQSILHVSDCF